MSDGGYDQGYQKCACFWGKTPASMVSKAISMLGARSNVRAIDLGCGEGKNAAAMSNAGFLVLAVDRSTPALQNAIGAYPDAPICWLQSDIVGLEGPCEAYDLVVATGSLHCLRSEVDIRSVIHRMQAMTKVGGIHVLSSFDDGPQDMRGHEDSFRPTLLPHSFYVSIYQRTGWEILESGSAIQTDQHPHNEVPHSHSITRLMARRVG
jgi:ubiquinone/menaquinone biosynthesis C-methylase UbiE